MIPPDLKPILSRPQPSSPEAEMSLLGSMMLDPSIVPEAMEIVTEADFDNESHRAIFSALASTYAKSGTGDLVQLVDTLRTRNVLELIGGEGYLVQLVSQVPTAVNFPHFAKIVADKARLRRLIDACGAAIYAAYHSGEDTEGVIETACEQVSAVTRSGKGRTPTTLQAAQAAVLNRLDNYTPSMWRTGISAFDAIGDGIPRCGVWTIFGTPGAGKSTLAMTVALNLASGMKGQLPVPVRICSFEQSAERIAASLLSSSTGVKVHRALNTGQGMTPEERAAINAAIVEQSDIDFEIFEENLTPPEVFAECVRLRRKHAEGVLILDYLQDVPPWGKFVDQTPRMSEAMRILARIARELGWLVVVISQIAKSVGKTNEQPQMADGLGSSAIEQRSDLITYVWRPHAREPRPTVADGGPRDWSGTAVLDDWMARNQRCRLGVLKSKFGGLGHCDLIFQGSCMRFRDPTEMEVSRWPKLAGEE